MDKKEFNQYVKNNKGELIGDYIVMPFVSAMGYNCIGCFLWCEMDGEYYISETPDYTNRSESALQYCVNWANRDKTIIKQI